MTGKIGQVCLAFRSLPLLFQPMLSAPIELGFGGDVPRDGFVVQARDWPEFNPHLWCDFGQIAHWWVWSSLEQLAIGALFRKCRVA